MVFYWILGFVFFVVGLGIIRVFLLTAAYVVKSTYDTAVPELKDYIENYVDTSDHEHWYRFKSSFVYTDGILNCCFYEEKGKIVFGIEDDIENSKIMQVYFGEDGCLEDYVVVEEFEDWLFENPEYDMFIELLLIFSKKNVYEPLTARINEENNSKIARIYAVNSI